MLSSPAPYDFENALNNEDWFALGYMVKCDEDDSDFRAIFNGYLDTYPPFIMVSYVVSVVDIESDLNSFTLYQNYPNPFNPSTVIRYHLPTTSYVELKVYDVLGSEVVNLISEEQHSGMYEVEFNATGLPSGFYFYQLKAGDFVQTNKMILMK